jgi:alpha-galactosidase
MFAVNLPNRGAVPNLPVDAILEIPAVATAGGLRPVQIADLSGPLAAILARKLAAVELTVEAALTGDRVLLVEALLVDGAVTDPTVAAQMGRELIEAHRRYLPNFA